MMVKVLNKSDKIEQDILNDINSGKYTDKLPSEKEMAKRYKTTPVTAAKILNRLKDRNIVYRVAGKGSFINQDFLQNKTRIYLPFEGEMLKEIGLELEKQFPETVFEFVKPKGVSIEEISEYTDITYLTSYFPDSYNKFFAPLPQKVLSEIQDDAKYYSGALDVHHQDLSYYGFPIFASPCVYMYNKELLKKYFKSNSQTVISSDDLQTMSDSLKKEKIALFDCDNFKKGIVLDFIFSQLNPEKVDRNNLSNILWQTIKKGLELFYNVYRDSIEKNASFAEGDAIFRRTCRQNISDQKFDKDFSWNLLTASLGQSCFSVLASAALFVMSKAPNQDKLFDICKAFLAPEIQNIIGKHKYGIPILKSAALSSLDSREIRDDIFFNEMNNVIFKYELFEKTFMNSFISDIYELFEKHISFKDFMARAENLYRLNEQNQKTKLRFANESYL